MSVDGKVTYEIRNAAVENKVLSETEFEGSVFKVTTGDYHPLLEKVNENLQKAIVRKIEIKIDFANALISV